MDAVKNGTAKFHFLEVMACPGGCLGGGGQPIPTNAEIRKRRAAAIYAEDGGKPLRKSHQNPEVIKIYQDFLGKPNGELSHHLLHTTYQPRERF
jgi:Iron only hydrogenase large subunit, C-terminal domain